MAEDSNLATDVKLIQNDLGSLQNILDRFDTTINKLTDVSNTLNKLIAVQESRIDTQEKSIEIVHKRITDMKEEMHQEMSGHYETIIEELKEMKEAQKYHADEMSTRVFNLEKWRYIVMGAGMVVGFLLAESTIWDKVF